ncbi:MAG TPA: hypothetical protein PLU52_03940 [Opitutaceae bacterium]|nr:hypothetical protein [Opitutaceae bacterium]HND61360.1 hypothetical protein [Opitutaceae bacterium]
MRRIGRLVAVLALGWCAQALAAGEVWVLRDDLSGAPPASALRWTESLRAAGIDSREIGSDELIGRLGTGSGSGSILLLANAACFPAEAVPALQAFLRRGNHLVAVSGPPFSRLMTRRADRWSDVDHASAAAPVLEAISPAYKLHRPHAVAVTVPGAKTPLTVLDPVFAPLPRSPGLGSEAVRKWRQIPLAFAVDADGARRGIAAQLLLNQGGEYAGSVWGYLGLSPADVERNAAASIALVSAMVRRIQGGLFLVNAGVDRFAVASGESVTLGAFATNLSGSAADAEVRFTVTSGPNVVQSSTKLVRLPAHNGGPAAMIAGETLRLPAGEYEVTTTLVRGGVTIDAITQPFRSIDFAPLPPDEVVAVHDGDFWLAGRRWYPFGINYWPRYVIGLEPADFSDAQWDPALYDSDVVEADLALAERLGLSMVSTQYNRLVQAGPVMDLLARAHRHHLRVHVFLPGLDPLKPNFPQAEALIRAAHLAESPAFFAYDLGWEVRAGLRAERAGRDRAWHRWVIDRYGSLESAEADWGYVPAREGGVIVGASDDQLKHDGPWRVYVAAYRRFWDDTISRGYRDVRSFIRSLDSHHLLGARSGFGGTGAEWIAEYLPFDLASGAKHLDFISPEHYENPSTRMESLKGTFTTAYARFVSGGKAVYWAEFGRPVAWKVEPANYDGDPVPATLRPQADYFRELIGMVHAGGANGCAGWWWPAGYRVDEQSDFGVVRPDLTLRPAAEEIAQAARGFYVPAETVKTAGEFVLDRDRFVTGYAGVYGVHGRAYAEAFDAGRPPRLRTEGTGTDSVNSPMIAVGNRPANGRNPLKFLNAEFNTLRLNGREVRDGEVVPVVAGRPVRVEASVGNTGESRWLARPGEDPGGVHLAVRWEKEERLFAVEQDTPFLQDARVPAGAITPRLDQAVEVSFRMMARGRGDFGEVIRVTLQPVPPDTASAPISASTSP